MAEKSETKEKNQEDKKETPFWEWVIAAVGLILVAGAIGFTFYRAVTEKNTAPTLQVTYDAPVPNGDGYLVKFHIKNSGNQTAAAVAVEGELKNGNESVETSTATLTYAPANSERHGGLYFSKNPQLYALQVRVAGYEEP